MKHLEIFLNQTKKMNGGSELKSYKQAKFFAWKLREALKIHPFSTDVHDEKMENFLKVAFFLTDENTHTNPDFVVIEVSWGGANGNSLNVWTGSKGKAKEILGI